MFTSSGISFFFRHAILRFALIFFCAHAGARAQGAGATGIVAGRVFNASGGVALRNAVVAVEPSGQQAVTDDDGVYRLSNIPAGTARLSVSYLGFTPQTVTLAVPAGGTVTRDLELSLRSGDGPVKLSALTVVADREMSAQAISLNERRLAPNIKNVVAYDEFGDRSAENIGDFLRFLPGVGIDEPAQIAQSVTLRGLPANTTGIQIDGAEVASARGNSREQSLLDIPVGNVSRVEVTKVPTPDQPANSLGGSLNIIRKSGFESKRRVLTFQSYFILDERALTLKGGPRGPTSDLSPRYQEPSIEVGAILPLTPRVAVTASASRTWRLKPMERDDYLDTQGDWNFVNGFQRLSTWQSLSQILRTWSVQLGTDIKLSERDTLAANVQYRNISNNMAFELFYGGTASRG